MKSTLPSPHGLRFPPTALNSEQPASGLGGSAGDAKHRTWSPNPRLPGHFPTRTVPGHNQNPHCSPKRPIAASHTSTLWGSSLHFGGRHRGVFPLKFLSYASVTGTGLCVCVCVHKPLFIRSLRRFRPAWPTERVPGTARTTPDYPVLQKCEVGLSHEPLMLSGDGRNPGGWDPRLSPLAPSTGQRHSVCQP